MPASVTDRCTNAYEHIFMLAKSKQYFFDAKAVQEPLSTGDPTRIQRARSATNKLIAGAPGQPPHATQQGRSNDKDRPIPTGRNRRDV